MEFCLYAKIGITNWKMSSQTYKLAISVFTEPLFKAFYLYAVV